MSEPFSWMDEGQGMKGVWRTDGGKKERREGGREGRIGWGEGRKAPQLSGRICLLFTHRHICTNTPTHPTPPHTYTYTPRTRLHAHARAPTPTQNQAHSTWLTNDCRVGSAPPGWPLTVPGHTQGQHYTGYTGNEGRWAGKREEGREKEKERTSANAGEGEKESQFNRRRFPAMRPPFQGWPGPGPTALTYQPDPHSWPQGCLCQDPPLYHGCPFLPCSTPVTG